MNHLPLPLNSTESEGSSKVASISPTSHSRETRKQQTTLPAVHQRTHVSERLTHSWVCVFTRRRGIRKVANLFGPSVICMSYANGCIITWLLRFYLCIGKWKKRCTFVCTCAEYVHSAHKGIINQFTFFWPIKSRTGEKAHGWVAGTCKNTWKVHHHFNWHWSD